MEAWTGIEPVYTDLQSAASPLRHQASIVSESGVRIREGLYNLTLPAGQLLLEKNSKKINFLYAVHLIF